MGAPANDMSLVFEPPRRTVQAARPSQKNKMSVDEILNLKSSDYSGMKSVGDTGYFMKGGKLYEPYTVTTTAPSYYFGSMPMGGGTNRAEGTIEVGNQAFRPVTSGSVEGFIEGDDGLELSQAYINRKQPKYQGRPQQNLFPLLSLATIPEQDIDPSTSSGAARFLSGDSLDMLSRAETNNDVSEALAGAGK